MKVRDSVP